MEVSVVGNKVHTEIPQPQPIEDEDLSKVAGGGDPDIPMGPRTE